MDVDSQYQGELNLRLLGGLSITLGGAAVRGFLSSKVQALLCYLAVTGRTHSRESLIAMLWGDMPEERASHGLRQALSNLQKLVGPHITITRQTVAFNMASEHRIDAGVFLALIKQAEEGGRRAAGFGVHRRLRQAVALYTGDFLDGFYVREAPEFDEWAAAQREQLRSMALDALHTLANYHSARGEYGTAIDYLRQLLSLDPWQEESHRQLMLLLAYEGKTDAAIAQFRLCKRVLAEEFGEEPSEETNALYRLIHEGHVEVPPVPVPPGNLTGQPERLVGRDSDLEAIGSLLEEPGHRLLTLTGSGGVGKTRLVLQIASDAAGDFVDGVFFVPLASVTNPDQLLGTIADVLGIETSSERPILQSIKSALRDKQMLLVLDNFEQLLAAAPQVAQLVGDLPGIRVLVTSRTSLRVRNERVYEVVPLAVPPLQDPSIAEIVASYSAAALFAERARQVRPDFAITDANALVVSRICHRLEGLPLAIELAAARLNIMPAQTLLARLNNRLGILTGGARDLPERQQAVRTTIEWSYDLLSMPQKDLFSRLSVFSAGCDLEAVEAICMSADVLEQMSALVDSSLVKRRILPTGVERFEMLEMVREYAQERLADAAGESAGAEEARRLHAEHYFNMVLAVRSQLIGPRQNELMDRFEMERGNLRAALGWACDTENGVQSDGSAPDLELAVSAATTLQRFWQSRGHVGEGRQWLEKLLSRPGSIDVPIRADGLRIAGVLAFGEGDLAGAARLCEGSLALYEQTSDTLGRASALNNLANTRRELGNYSEAIALYTESLELCRRIDDKMGVSVALNNLGATYVLQGDFGRASTLYEESLVLRRAFGDSFGIAYILYRVAEASRELGDFGRATAACEESMAISEKSGDKQGKAMAVLAMGMIKQAQQDDTSAESLYKDCLLRFTDTADRWGIATAKHRLGTIAYGRGQFEQALDLYRDSLQMFRENGDKRAESLVLADLRRMGDVPDDVLSTI